jgi:2-oxoglutarate ferredoxin oxidoreductase subunit gamma
MTQKAKQSGAPDRFEVRLSGAGGQGLILAGVILAEAIGTIDGKNAVQSQSYGPEARGGASRADVVISKEEIFYPKTMKLDLLLALTQEACDKYYPDLKDDGTLIIDSGMVSEPPTPDCYGFPFVQLAKSEIGIAMVANVISLGAICELTGIVSKHALTEVVKMRAPRGTEEKNLKALEVGFRIAKEAKNQH